MREHQNDLDELIDRLKSFDINQLNLLLEIIIKMSLMGFGGQFIEFLFSMLDVGHSFEINVVDFDNDKVLSEFDDALRTEDKIQVLINVGNENFIRYSSGYFTTGVDLVMITTFIRFLIGMRVCFKVLDPVINDGMEIVS